VKWFVPQGLKEWFTTENMSNGKILSLLGIENEFILWLVEEMDWWDETTFKKKKKEEDEEEDKNNNFKTVHIAFTPTQHWSGRGVADRNKSLWGSFCVWFSDGSSSSEREED